MAPEFQSNSFPFNLKKKSFPFQIYQINKITTLLVNSGWMNFRVSKVRLELYILSLLQYKIKSFSLIWLSLSHLIVGSNICAFFLNHPLCFPSLQIGMISVTKMHLSPDNNIMHYVLFSFWTWRIFFLYKSNTDDITIWITKSLFQNKITKSSLIICF